ncbi:MAG: SEL1-like repeat protein [Corallococcus sp.]|nr:SEL1-like repeat protein [Bacillota bacterium]MCM1533336.1 SEL1-like repeat protein [Corallococcus sp.]
MPQSNVSNGKRAFKLYNKTGASEREKERAIQIINGEKTSDLDAYGRFVRAEIIFWQDFAPLQDRIDAFDTFRSMSCDNTLPTNLVVGACFFAARCYELGFATEQNFDSALICYRAANKLNPKACLKDIARLEKAQTSVKTEFDTATPPKFQYNGSWAADSWAEWEVMNDDKLHTNIADGLRTLKRTGFFYEDDPDEVDADLYSVPDKTDET